MNEPVTLERRLERLQDDLVALSGQLCWIRREPPPDGYKESNAAIMAEIETEIAEVQKQIENLQAEQSRLGGS